MLSYTMIGTNNLKAAGAFYDSILFPLGYEVEEWKGRLIYFIPGTEDSHNGPGAFYVTTPYDGAPASVGNGSMVAFKTDKQKNVRELHCAGLKNGGTDDGQPGFRDDYGPSFYVGYLRDPDGNKLAIFCTNPFEPKRP